MTKQFSRRVVAAGLVLLGFILLQAPATLVYLALQTRLPELRVSGMAGTVWRGKAMGIAAPFGGQAVGIGKLDWQVRPWSLFLLHPGIDFQGRQDDQKFSGRLDLSLTSGWHLRDTTLELPLARLGQMETLPLDGTIEIDLDSLSVVDARLRAIEGRAWLRSATLFVAGKRFLLGDLAAELDMSGEGGLRADFVSDSAQPMGISGALVINPAGNYQLETVVALEADKFSDLERLLPLLGESLGGRQYRLVFAGNMQ